MFDSENRRTQLLGGFLAVMLVLAGCSANVSNERSTETPNPASRTRTPAAANQPTSVGMNPSEFASLSNAGENQASLTASQRAKVRDTVATFYNLSTNQSKRRQASQEAAESICEKDAKYKTQAKALTAEAIGKESSRIAHRMDFAAQIVNEKLNGNVDRANFKQLRDGTRKATKYVPLLGSYQSLVSKACLADRRQTKEAIEKFHIAALMFGVDAALVAGAVYYEPAFAGTRFVTNQASKLGLYRLRYLCGNRCWALAMSEVHWVMRGSMLTVTSNLARNAIDMGVDLTQEDVRSVLEKQGHDPEKYIDDSNVDFRKLSKCQPDAASRIGNATSDLANESGDLLDGGDASDNDSRFSIGGVVKKGKSVVNDSLSSAESLKEDCSGIVGGDE